VTNLKITEGFGLNWKALEKIFNAIASRNNWAGHHEDTRFGTTEDLCVLWRYRERITHYRCENLFTPRNEETSWYLASCSCSLFVTVSVCRETDASFRHSKTLSQFQNIHGPIYRLWLSIINFIKAVLFSKFHKIFQDRLLFFRFQIL